MSVLEEIRAAVEHVADRAGASVVGLGHGWGLGCGVVLAEGVILTNAHNLRTDDVAVAFGDGRRANGRVIATDADSDLGVVAVETAETPPLEWSDDAAAAATGAPVFAVANPGGRGLRVTFGLVSSSNRSFRVRGGRRAGAAIEHTAPALRGSSGSALVDPAGRLLGVNSIRLEGGLILALAANEELRERAERLARGEAPARVRLGVAIAPPRAARRMRHAVGLPERDGLLVRAVEEGTAADEAGITHGDLIVAAGEKPIERLDALFDALDGASSTGSLRLTIVRGTDERDVVVSLREA